MTRRVTKRVACSGPRARPLRHSAVDTGPAVAARCDRSESVGVRVTVRVVAARCDRSESVGVRVTVRVSGVRVTVRVSRHPSHCPSQSTYESIPGRHSQSWYGEKISKKSRENLGKNLTPEPHSHVADRQQHRKSCGPGARGPAILRELEDSGPRSRRARRGQGRFP